MTQTIMKLSAVICYSNYSLENISLVKLYGNNLARLQSMEYRRCNVSH